VGGARGEHWARLVRDLPRPDTQRTLTPAQGFGRELAGRAALLRAVRRLRLPRARVRTSPDMGVPEINALTKQLLGYEIFGY
jgi:hypothetical protein